MTHPAITTLARWQELEAEISRRYAELRDELKPLFEERDRLLALRAEELRYQVPRRRDQTDTQLKMQRCPRCRGQLDAA